MKPRYVFITLIVAILLLLIWGDVQDWQKFSDPKVGDTALYSNDHDHLETKNLDSTK